MKTVLSIMIFMGLTNCDILVLIVYQIRTQDKLVWRSAKCLQRHLSLYLLCLVFCGNWLSWNREKWWLNEYLQDYDFFF